MNTAPLAPTRLRTEMLDEPKGVDVAKPRLSWEVVDPRRGAVQAAYQIQVAGNAAELAADGGTVWDSGRVASDASNHVSYAGPRRKSFSTNAWRVRTWDADGAESPWSEVATWETGALKPSDWKGDWIGAPPRAENATAPSPYLRTTFAVKKAIASARLVVTARGSYECWLNGQRVGEDYFTPGWTEYDYRIPYQIYDVTALLQDGENALGAILADGWYAGEVMNTKTPKRAEWGTDISFLANLRITDTDGRTTTLATGPDWTWSEGPIRAADHYNGETYDARLERPDWATASAGGDWQPVHVYPASEAALVAKTTQNVRKIQTLAPIEQTEPSPGAFVYDLGQNMVGWARIRLTAPAGTVITLRFAEMLQADKTLYTENLRAAKCTDYYTCRGGGEEIYEPRFTFHGFRYIEISGVPAALPMDAVTGVVLHSATPPTGEFVCSHEMVNQLQSNIVWGQKSNFFEAPTDCPQRNERLGWTGDAQVFVRTAAWNMDVAAFFTKWAQDMEDSQDKLGDGRFPHVSPDVLHGGAACAWADAGVICPWTMYLCYGDTAILDRHFDSMAAWVDFMERESNDLIRPESGFGDWLAVEAPNPGYPLTLKSLIGTAYFARCCELVSQAAVITGRKRAAGKYRSLHKKVVKAFNNEYVTPSGRMVNHNQTAYLLALGFELLPEAKREVAIHHLVADIEKRGNHLSTGFVGTPFLAPVLTAVGRTDKAYDLLLQDTYPSWFYPIKNGATTMWERWNSYTHEHGFGPVGMNSFNHYAYGAIGEWLYNTVAGIDIDPTNPGYKHTIFRPEPGGGLTHARASIHSIHGRVASEWALSQGTFALTVTIPANTSATVHLPVADPAGVTLDGATPSSLELVNARVTLRLPAGTYTLTAPWHA